MNTSWKHLVIAVLFSGTATWASAQQPASVPAANHALINPVIQTTQPSSSIVSGNVFDLQKYDLARGTQDQAVRCATQPGNDTSIWREVNSDQAHCVSIPGLETGVLIQRIGQK